MKQLLRVTTLRDVATAMAALLLMAACQTVATNDAELAASKKEFLLAQSGFRVITVTTPKQQAAVSKLAVGQVSPVKYQGKLYYVYPTATKDKIYVGRQKQVNTYNQAVTAQQNQPGQNNMNPAPTMTFQGHGQHQIVAEEFDGFGPMGVNALGDW